MSIGIENLQLNYTREGKHQEAREKMDLKEPPEHTITPTGKKSISIDQSCFHSVEIRRAGYPYVVEYTYSMI